MILNVFDKEQYIDIPIGEITQWCGFNVQQKRRIIDMLCKYFSTYKFQEYEANLSENIKIDGENIGRKYIEVNLIKDKAMLLDSIVNTKIGLLNTIIKKQADSFENITQLDTIDNILLSIFENINKSISEIGDVAIEYERESLWSIIQKSAIKTKEGRYLIELSNDELIKIYINSLRKFEVEPCNQIIIFENIDHLISDVQYKELINRCKELADGSNIRFIFTTSLPDYLIINELITENVTVFNEIVYSLPNLERISEFIANYYPYNIRLEKKELEQILAKAIPYFNYSKGIITSFTEPIIAKLISETNAIKYSSIKTPAKPEIAYFFS